jgi:hypothetical protein
LSCAYSTMGACEQARPGASADQCITRSDADGTTGLGNSPPPPPLSPRPAPREQSPAPER